MKETHNYLVPDYYPNFACKMGACRTSCCEGWPVSLSMEDYFRLLGVNCRKSLRGKLDCALHVLDRPTQEEYARIQPRFDGNCPLRLEDGRCAIHAELGEAALSAVCRLYPRGPRAEGDYECSCSNSCEAVIELFLRRDAPLKFLNLPLTFDLPAPSGRTVFFETVGREQEIRLHFIRILQDRARSMPERMLTLGLNLREMEAALDARDARKVDLLLRETAPKIPPMPDSAGSAALECGLRMVEGMLEILDAHSRSLRSYGEAALALFGQGLPLLSKYRTARTRFEEIFPRWEIYFEHILVNHMFFSRFPFQDRPESLADEFLALCAVYALLRFLCVGWMADKQAEADFVDVVSAAFRLIDHTEFDRYASRLLRKLGCKTPETICDLLLL